MRTLLSCSVISLLLSYAILPLQLLAQQSQPPRPLRVGYIGCQTGIAAAYGASTLDGLLLAQEELRQAGKAVEVLVEDDLSETKNTVSALQSLKAKGPLDGLVTGSWWANSIVRPVESMGIPFISCETNYNQDAVLAPNFFIFGGDLKTWVYRFEPLIKNKGWKRGAILRFSSGFGATLRDGMEEVFSRDGRSFVGTLEYSSIDAMDALSLLPRLKQMNPDVLYIDATPSGLATILKRYIEQKLTNIVVLTNSIAEQAVHEKLFSATPGLQIYFTKRAAFDAEFSKRFKARYGREPILDADLGYYALKLLSHTHSDSPQSSIQALKAGVTLDGKTFNFDQKNVYRGLQQQLWNVDVSPSGSMDLKPVVEW